MKKKVRLFVLLIILFAGIEIFLMYSSRVPLTNQIYRVVSGAPAVHLNGKLLYYHGTLEMDHNHLVLYKQSDEYIDLYIVREVPEGMRPPWVHVLKKDNLSYRYSFPNPPGSA